MNRLRCLYVSAVLSCCSRVAALRMVSPRRIQNPLRRTRSSTSALSMRQNCAGCHGVDGKGGAAIALPIRYISPLPTML